MKNKKIKILLTALLTITITIIAMAASYAYFTASITGTETNTSLYISGGELNINYLSSPNIVLQNIYPKTEKWETKTFTLTGNNTTELNMHYEIFLVITKNDFNPGYLKYNLSGTNPSSNGEVIENRLNKSILNGTREQKLGEGFFKGSIEDIKHNYALEILFPSRDLSQNTDQSKSFEAHIEVRSKNKKETEIPSYYVLATDEDFYGTENGDFCFTNKNIEYVIIPQYIKGVLVTSAKEMFTCGTPDLKGVATLNNNITNMNTMFKTNSAYSLELLYLDTSNVIDMSYMFHMSNGTILDLSSFDTSKVTDMSSMFENAQATTINLNSFTTSKVTNFNKFLYNSKVESINFSSFDTSSALTMKEMFYNIPVLNLNLSSFDTSNVTDMNAMFQQTKATNINLSSFDTFNVTDMGMMFLNSEVLSLDLSTFTTKNLINTNVMFYGVPATVGYAKTLEDAEVFNLSSMKPETINFIIK